MLKGIIMWVLEWSIQSSLWSEQGLTDTWTDISSFVVPLFDNSCKSLLQFIQLINSFQFTFNNLINVIQNICSVSVQVSICEVVKESDQNSVYQVLLSRFWVKCCFSGNRLRSHNHIKLLGWKQFLWLLVVNGGNSTKTLLGFPLLCMNDNPP